MKKKNIIIVITCLLIFDIIFGIWYTSPVIGEGCYPNKELVYLLENIAFLISGIFLLVSMLIVLFKKNNNYGLVGFIIIIFSIIVPMIILIISHMIYDSDKSKGLIKTCEPSWKNVNEITEK